MDFKDDLVSFLKSGGKKPFILSSRSIPGRWRNRLIAIRGGFSGGYPFLDALFFILPTSLRPHHMRRRIWDNFIEYTHKEAKRAIAPYVNKDGSVTLYGNDFFVPFGNYDDLIDMIEQSIVSDQYHAGDYLKEGAIVIDAGANAGVFSVFASAQCRAGTIYAFEPSPYTFEVLSRNTKAYPGIRVFPMGLGDTSSTKRILVYPNSTTGNIMEDSSRTPFIFAEHIEKKEEVMVISIDDFIKAHDVPRVDFIKIDTEGYEAKILEGAKETIRKFRPVIAMSAYHTPADRELLPKVVHSIDPEYQCDFVVGSEEEFICHPVPTEGVI